MKGMRLSATVVWLTVLWVGLWGQLSVANVVSGGLVAGLVLAFARRSGVPPGATRIRPLRVAWLLVVMLYKIVVANLVVAWEIITPGNRITTGIVAVQLRTRSGVAMMLTSNIVGLTPGTMVLEVKGATPVIYVHALHLRDPDELRRDVYEIEELAVRAFGSAEALATLIESSDTRPDAGHRPPTEGSP